MEQKRTQKSYSRSLGEHLNELRLRLLKSVFSLLPAFFICWFFSEPILNFLRRPLEPFLKNTKGGLIFTAPMDQLIAHLQVAFYSAIFLCSPYWLGQLWRFISPGLYKREKKIFVFFWLTGTVLFILGACFAYFAVFPFLFSMLMNVGNSVDQPFITIKSYLSFVARFTFVFGLVFEMPLILLFLCRLGVLSPEILRQHRRHAVLLLSVLSAFITPPDVLSLFLLLIPLMALYEISIQLARFFQKKDFAG